MVKNSLNCLVRTYLIPAIEIIRKRCCETLDLRTKGCKEDSNVFTDVTVRRSEIFEVPLTWSEIVTYLKILGIRKTEELNDTWGKFSNATLKGEKVLGAEVMKGSQRW